MKRSMFLVVILAFGLMAVPAFADVWVIDILKGVGSGGSITGSIGSGFTGTGIAVDLMSIYKNFVLVANYDLSGSGIGSGGNGAAVVDFNTTSGYFTVVGGVPVLGVGPTTTLVTGTGSVVITAGSNLVALTFTQPDFKDSGMLVALGIPTGTRWQFMDATFATISGSGGRTVSGVNIQNTSVPDGGVTLMLLGGALIGLETLRRRTFRA